MKHPSTETDPAQPELKTKEKTITLFEEVLGWLGALAIILAYALVSFGFIDATSPVYLMMNLFGSVFVLYISVKKQAFQPALINLFWVGISLLAFISFFRS